MHATRLPLNREYPASSNATVVNDVPVTSASLRRRYEGDQLHGCQSCKAEVCGISRTVNDRDEFRARDRKQPCAERVLSEVA